MRRFHWFWLLVLAHPAASSAITLGQVDDFQDGTMNGWPSSVSPTNVADGGPAGIGDRYLRITSTGSTGAGKCLRAVNGLQWAGNYLGAGVTAVEMDLRNEATTDLQIRIWIFSQSYGAFMSTTPFALPGDFAWHHAVFGLAASDLTRVRGSRDDLMGTLSNNQSFAILHQVGPLQPGQDDYGTPVASQLGIDNIEAVPEPATLAIVALGAAMLGRRHVSLSRLESLRIGGVL